MPAKPPGTSRRFQYWFLGGLLVAILLANAWLIFWRNPGGPPAPPGNVPAEDDRQALTAAQKLDLWQAKERAVGLLENHKYVEAVEPLIQIAAVLPDDPVGSRDAVIALLLAMETGNATADAAATALEILKKVEPDAFSTHILSAKIAAQSGDVADAIQQLGAATQTFPDDVRVWFELGQLQRDSADPEVRRAAGASFQRAWELAPENLAVLWNLIQSQTQQQRPEVAETLRAARPLIAPLAADAREAGVDLPQKIDDALRAAEESRDADLFRDAFVAANVIKAHPLARRDAMQAAPHPLAYVVQDFRPEFYENWTAPQPAAGAEDVKYPIDVRFTESPAQLTFQEPVIDFVVADFDLDERSDVIVLLADRIEVYGRGGNAAAWSKVCETPVPTGMQHVITGDLDEDVTAEATPQTERCHNVDIDLIVYGDAGALVLQNRLDTATGKRSLAKIEQTAEFSENKMLSAVVLFDVDHDATLDLVTASPAGIRFWQNRSGMKFRGMQMLSGDPDHVPQALAAVDWDRDIDIDVIAAGDGSETATILRNHRHGRFSRQELAGEFAPLTTARGLAVLDADGNGSWDVVTAGEDGLRLIRTQTLETAVVEALEVTMISPPPAVGVLTWDYDNDGRTDLLAWGEQGLKILRGDGLGGFTTVGNLVDPPMTTVRQCRVDDVDADGDLDLLAAGAEGLVIYDNQGGNQNHRLNIRLVAEQEKGGASPDPGGRVNYHGVGSLLELRLGDRYIPQMVTGQVTHFGLG